MAGCCEQGNEPSGFIKSGNISKLSEDLQLLTKDASSWS